MPKATISQQTVHKDLHSLPEGFVELRRMPYGQWLHRQELAMRMSIETQGSQRNNQGIKGEMVMANQAVTQFEFTQCIVDHNLENDAGEKMDFRSAQSLQLLDPKVGNEIATYIMELHEFDSGNSSSGSDSS
jgi:hypothetical protein